MYIDDGIAGEKWFQKVAFIQNLMLNDLASAGLTVNFKKSSLVIEKQKTWLGFLINTENMHFEVPERKIQKILDLLKTTPNQHNLRQKDRQNSGITSVNVHSHRSTRSSSLKTDAQIY